MMPNLIPPKIPDGEKVDFDVSYVMGGACICAGVFIMQL